MRRQRTLPLASLAVAASLFAGCVAGPSGRASSAANLETAPWEDPSRVLVRVNGEPITRGDFYRRIIEKVGTRTLLAEVVTEELFRQEAERLGIEVSDEEVGRAAERFIDGMAQESGGRADLLAQFEEQGVSLEQLKRDLAPTMRAELLRHKVVRSRRKIDEETLRRYYEETYKNKRYVTRHLAYSYEPREGSAGIGTEGLKLQALQKATRAIEQVRNGHDFAQIARFESDDAMTAESGGYLGPIHESSPLPPEFKEAIFSLREGEVSQPVQNPRAPGIHVFQVTEILPSEGFVECEEKMRGELLDRAPSAEESRKVAEELRRNASIDWVAP